MWNDFVGTTNPLLAALQRAGGAAGGTLRQLQLRPIAGTMDSNGEEAIQAGLDDVDTLTNQALAFADSRLT